MPLQWTEINETYCYNTRPVYQVVQDLENTCKVKISPSETFSFSNFKV